jgi:hypothetical protein
MALEAGFGGAGVPAPGLNVVFARLRVRIDDVIPGATYIVRHPYGETDSLIADDKGQVRLTVDLGIAEGDLTRVLKTGEIAPFLVWDGVPPEGYLGDGVTEHAVKSDPALFRTFVEISGPRIAEGSAHAVSGNINLVRTNLFVIQGRRARRFGVEATSVTYSKEAGGTFLDVTARSVANQAIELVGTGLRVGLAARGPDYVVRTSVPALPSDLRILNAKDDPVFVAAIPAFTVTDRVIVEKATLDVAAKKLTVVARSSDPAAVLTVESFGAMASPTQSFPGVTAAPEFVTVRSSKNGVGVQRLELIGAGAAQLGVAAGASGPERAAATFPFLLDGSGSRGPGALSYAWTQTGGPAGALVNGTSRIAKFTPSVAGTYTFRLTVSGAGGTATDTVTVTVGPKPPVDQVTVTRAEYRTRSRQFRITGSVNNVSTYDAGTGAFVSNTVVVRLGSFEIGRANPDATGVWDVRLTLAGVGGPNVPGVGSQVTISTGTTATVRSINIRN